MYPYIKLFRWEIPSYGLLMLTGFVAAWCMVAALSRGKPQFRKGDVGLTFLIGVCGGFIGAYSIRPVIKLAEVALKWNVYSAVPSGELLQYIFGEVVFLGGLIGGAAAVFIFCRCFKIKTLPIADLFAPAAALGHGIGRIGCLLGGCCYGIEVPGGNLLSIIYPHGSLGAPSGIPLLSVPLIETVFLFALSIVLIVLYKNSGRSGICCTVYLLLYPVERFIIEFFRGDTVRGKYGFLTTSQYVSILVFCAGLWLMLFAAGATVAKPFRRDLK